MMPLFLLGIKMADIVRFDKFRSLLKKYPVCFISLISLFGYRHGLFRTIADMAWRGVKVTAMLFTMLNSSQHQNIVVI